MNIRITGLARKATESEVKELFKPFGTVTSVTIVMDRATGKSKGFGFIEMENRSEATKAISELNKKKFLGERLTVKEVK